MYELDDVNQNIVNGKVNACTKSLSGREMNPSLVHSIFW